MEASMRVESDQTSGGDSGAREAMGSKCDRQSTIGVASPMATMGIADRDGSPARPFTSSSCRPIADAVEVPGYGDAHEPMGEEPGAPATPPAQLSALSA